MKVIWEFGDKAKTTSVIEVTGDLVTEFCIMAGCDPDNPPETVEMSAVEKRSDRKHHRPHKYTGKPVSHDELAESGAEVPDGKNVIADVDSAIAQEQALATLTDLQRFCFVEVCLNGRTQREVASELGKSRNAVVQAIEGARKKLKNFF